jgi:hypothetical protein
MIVMLGVLCSRSYYPKVSIGMCRQQTVFLFTQHHKHHQLHVLWVNHLRWLDEIALSQCM